MVSMADTQVKERWERFRKRLEDYRVIDDAFMRAVFRDSLPLYVNAAYRGDDALGSLMADFCQSDPDKIRNELLRKRVHYLKRDEKGTMEMLNVSEEIYNEGREEGAQDNLLNNVRSLMETVGWTAQEALERLKVPKADQQRYIAML